MTNVTAKRLACLSCLMTFLFGCIPTIPKMDYPLEMQKRFNVSFDKAWDAAIEAIKESQGNIISSDKDSGLIFCSLQGVTPNVDSRYYANVYIERGPAGNILVYFVPYTGDGRSIKGIDKEFYDKLGKFI